MDYVIINNTTMSLYRNVRVDHGYGRLCVAQDCYAPSADLGTLDARDLKAAEAEIDTVDAQTLVVAQDLRVDQLKATDAEVTTLTAQNLTVTGSATLPGGGGGGGGGGVLEAETTKVASLEPRQDAIGVANTMLKPGANNVEEVDINVYMTDAWHKTEDDAWEPQERQVTALRVGHTITGAINAKAPLAQNRAYPNLISDNNRSLAATYQNVQGLRLQFTLPPGAPYAIAAARVVVLPTERHTTNRDWQAPAGLGLLEINDPPLNSIALTTQGVPIGNGDVEVHYDGPQYTPAAQNTGFDQTLEDQARIRAITPFACHVGAHFELYLTELPEP